MLLLFDQLSNNMNDTHCSATLLYNLYDLLILILIKKQRHIVVFVTFYRKRNTFQKFRYILYLNFDVKRFGNYSFSYRTSHLYYQIWAKVWHSFFINISKWHLNIERSKERDRSIQCVFVITYVCVREWHI